MSGKPLKALEAKYEEEKKARPNLSFAAFVTESALLELERRDMLKEAQLISLVVYTDDTAILKDARKGNNKFFEVQIRSKKLKCLTDDNFDCSHVGFALALPQVRTALAKDNP